jgi:hypothetical protein
VRSPTQMLLIAAALAGCASSSDLQGDPSLNSTDRSLASRVAELASGRCTTHSYDPITEDKRTDDVKVSGSVAVKRLYRSASGWIKAEVVANSVWDNVYLFEKNGSLVCGEKNWQKLSDAATITFLDVGKPPTLSTAAISTEPNVPRALDVSVSVRPIALRWEGYANLISGTVKLIDGGKRGNITATLPGGEGRCSGIYEFARANSGHWALSCTNNLSATGTFEASGAGKGSTGRGKDARGNLVEFSVGGTQ